MKDMDENITKTPFQSWFEANRSYLWTHVSWLRLILHRRVLWLRQQWKHDPLQNYQGQVISDIQADWLLAGEDYLAERKFYNEEKGAKEVTRAMDETAGELEKQSNAMLEAGMPAALDVLTQIFGLSSFDRNILMLCLAPEIDPAFERLYAYVQDDILRKYVTFHLALSLFAADPDSELFLKHGFLPEAPLFKFELVHRENPSHLSYNQASSPLRIDPRIADYLQGINRLDERVADILKPLPRVESLTPSYEEIVHTLRRLIETTNTQSSLPVINFTGPARTGKRNVAARLCDTLGIELLRLNPKELHFSGLNGTDIVPVLERECMLLPTALYIDTSEMEDSNDPAEPLVNTLMDRLNTFFMISSAKLWRCERKVLNIPIPKLNGKEQFLLWKQMLNTHEICLDGEIGGIVEQFDFESDMIAETITAAKTRACIRDDKISDVILDDIWTACREQSQNDLDGLAQRIIPCYGWEDIVLPKETFEQLKDIANQVTHRALVYEKWGFGAKLSRGRGISALFSGSSGTGKSMAAEILANHLKLDLYRIDLSAVVSKYIGETEKNLRRVFDAAEQSGAILFFDEADALFGKRTEVKDSHDRYANIEINYLLQRMEDYRGLAILATNMKSLLDQAFLRRLRFHVEFPFPDTEYRRKIWQKVFPFKAAVGDLDYHFLERFEIPGGNIRNIALNAAFLAADDGKVIGTSHILRAAKQEYAKIDKMVLESEFGSYYSQIK